MASLSSKRLCSLLLVCLACTSQTSSVNADATTYRRVLRSTTWVLAKGSAGTSSGTGVLVDQERRLVITNAHVVGDARNTVVFFPSMKDESLKVDRNDYLENVKKLGVRGRVLAVDRKRDLALIELDKLPAEAQAIGLATSSPSPGEDVESIGNPGSTDALWVYTSGTVRAVYQKKFHTGTGEHDFKVVETQSPINSGDSGGPVVNSEGKLVEISQAIAPNARLVSYCVDVTEVKIFLESPWKPAPLPVSKVLDSAELTYQKQQTTGHFQLELDSVDKEQQTVFVGKDVEYYERADVRKIWSLAKSYSEKPSLETTMLLLEQSARTKIGSWVIEKNASNEYLVLYTVKIDATATPDALKSTLQYVSKLTGAMKKELSKQDEVKDASDTLADWLTD